MTNIGDSTCTPTQNGAYTVEVTNSIATERILYSGTISVSAAVPVLSNDIALSQLTNKPKFSIFPNPAKTMVTITFNTKETAM